MKQVITEEEDGNTAIHLDEEGIKYLIEGLVDLLEDGPGGLRTTPAVWTETSPWWKFWDRKETPVVGEFKLRYVTDE
jgi:hypothetical protein